MSHQGISAAAQGISAAARQVEAPDAVLPGGDAELDLPVSGHDLAGESETVFVTVRERILPPAAASISAAETVDAPAAAETVDAPAAANILGSSGGDGDSDDDQARRHCQGFKRAMAKVRRGLVQVRQSTKQPERKEEIRRLIAEVDTQTKDADELLKAGTGQPPDRAFRLAAGQSALACDIEDAHQEADDADGSLWGNIRRWLDHAGRKLWALISRLTKVREWSLTGTVGTGVLGLAKASISVTFGHPPDS